MAKRSSARQLAGSPNFRAEPKKELVDDSGNAIRRYEAWTFIDSLFRPTCYGPAWLAYKRDPNTPALLPNATLPWCSPGSSAMCLCRQLVHLGGFPVRLVHSLASRKA